MMNVILIIKCDQYYWGIWIIMIKITVEVEGTSFVECL